jgi:ABC-type polysaccharide/polyol phosphate transport system ATPase subunit
MFRQKLAWTIAMSTQAKTFAVDEMLVVGDPEFRERCFEQIKLLKAAGTTFLVATEVPRKFEGFFDRAIVLHDGGVVADSSFADGLALLRELRLANSITDTAETKSDPKARPESEDGF